ncbi:MAG: 16S rRNA (cytidine(1402)-2'-O)-methyltransferase [Chloroflexi bacterium]|nr:16S rRNA (cytidine(1402)-2'-O)-methyltransferase [Chloroflexota bacterium]
MLSIVSTPIGNPDDMTLRALRVLREVNAVICEERRDGARLLKHYQIENTLLELNEHTERAIVPELIERLERGEHLALISDHGTPLLADPGGRLVARAIQARVPVTAVPGASSALAALVVSGLPMDRFRFVGMLPVKKEARRAELRRLKDERETWVVLDAPYRLAPLLADLRDALGAERYVTVACELTTANENIVRGTLREIVAYFEKKPFKGEFALVVAGNPKFKILNSEF